MLNKISFRIKLYISILIMVIIPVTLLGSILYRRLVYEITSQISRVVANSLNSISDYIESSLDTVRIISTLLLEEERIAAVARSPSPMTDRELLETNIMIRRLFFDYIRQINSSFGFDSFYLYFSNHNLLLDSKTTYYEQVKAENIDFLGHSPAGPHWFTTVGVDFYTINGVENPYGYSRLLTFANEILDEDGRPVVNLAANVSVNFIGDYYRRIQRGVPGDFIIIDNMGNLIAASSTLQKWGDVINAQLLRAIESSYGPSGNFEVSVDEQSYFSVFSRSAYSGWHYVALTPEKEILGQIHDIQRFFIILIVIIMILIIPICFFISGTLYKPLEKLVLAMQNVKNGNLDTPIKDLRKDEYQKVYEGFNLMLGELKQLIEDLSNEKFLNKQAELDLIQAQINPHFLYNTLDSIYSIAIIHKVDEISNMAAALSKFFRVSLSGGKTDISLKEALDIVKSYLTIQNIRFKGKIKFEIAIPEQFMDIIVPKLLLQPIVENSIYHGLEKKKGKGRLSISCSQAEAALCIHIDDDGVGMSEEQLEALEKIILGEEDDKHFALKTLNKQIMLKYGKNYGLRIKGQYGKGTRVTISLPHSAG